MQVSTIAESRSIDNNTKAPIRMSVRTPWKRRLASWSRWLHIYISTATSAVLLFFSATGLMLNHQDWFSGLQRTSEYHGEMNPNWVKAGDSKEVAKLEIVEYLRRTHAIKGAVADFRIEDAQCTVSFKGPGYAADAFIERETGRYQLTENRLGFAAVVGDLHKGRDTGNKWGMVLDVSAVLMICVSVTGLMLVFYLIKRRVSALLVLAVGGVLFYLLYLVFVP